MLFNSYVFLFGFLPPTLLGFFLVARWSRRLAGLWLVLASFVFYGWWNVSFLPVLVVSVAFNYGASELIGACSARPRLQTWLLGLAVAANLAALGYYKYLVAVLGFLHGAGVMPAGLSELGLPNIVLPLGISFFTFTQLGYLVDVKQGVAKDRGPLNYLMFVTFFPHLIAGPILHNREMMPQFADPGIYRPSGQNLSMGATIFVIGLLKKCLLADPISDVVAPGFAAAGVLPMAEAWNVALSYSLQLYFDFSGYSDMAIGLACLFNVRFPLNFNSPYKAASIIDYWQRWHMTLTRYLNLYLYNPVALWATRRRMAKGLGTTRQAQATPSGFFSMVLLPTFFTMALAGIWHGAGFQFLIFGLLHAVYLSVNHAWRIYRLRSAGRGHAPADGIGVHAGKVLLTYLCVLVASVFFRAPSTGAAIDLLAGMLGAHGIGAGVGPLRVLWLAALYAIVWGLPNTQQIMSGYQPVLGKVQPGPLPWLRWRADLPWAVALGCGAIAGLLSIGNATEFLYFQF